MRLRGNYQTVRGALSLCKRSLVYNEFDGIVFIRIITFIEIFSPVSKIIEIFLR